MPSQATNASRDTVEVHNRLDKVVLALRVDGEQLETPLTPDEARRVAELLVVAADTGDRAAGS